MSTFSSLTALPADPILGLTVAFLDDSNPDKVNLGVGAYKDASGQPYLLPSVSAAEKIVHATNHNREYLPIDGLRSYHEHLRRLILGEALASSLNDHLWSCQTIGGTGAIRLAAELAQTAGITSIHLSEPTWSNHPHVIKRAGLEPRYYPYYDAASAAVDFSRLFDYFSQLPERSLIMLQPCCHNPTGADLTKEQWDALRALFAERNHLTLFDMAYQGLGKGLEEDPYPIRSFIEAGLPCFVSYSCAKNFGLYVERLGMLMVHLPNSQEIAPLASHAKSLIRGNYSSPAAHGARIVVELLGSSTLVTQWHEELAGMRQRITSMRQELVQRLQSKQAAEDQAHIAQQQGLFSLLKLTPEQVIRLREEYSLYMPNSARVNVAGLNMKNLDYVAEAIVAVST